ncbi:4Fe-4S binding protein [Desulfosporosinus hippei]|uniref:4Fe-4S binding domain-containing protein n=1 Tax=Desulfosporosinus hippei DSM 8344 TaxID=1121419 RepID=A0A1G8E3H0_9FIRM|nr:4Fe-4S binding protein [Desulfosporosinus hippei]SDH64486.1 4Fe-4S binding domain-containing protein [Desulfosporosinus hippei DSM 8344]
MAENISTVLLTIFFVLLSVLYGRFFCGRICPIGLMQDLLNKIPFPKKIFSFKGDKYLRYLKYVLLILMVAANLFGYATASHETQPFNAGLAIGWAGFALLCIVISPSAVQISLPCGPNPWLV